MGSALSLHDSLFFLKLLAFSIALTEVIRAGSVHFGFVNRPAAQRWNKRVVALGGGIAICLTILAGFLSLGSELSYTLLPAFLLLFGLGLYDDARGISPSGKLLFQVAAASFAVSKGYLFPFSWPVASITISIIWIVGVTNALNLIDNMDGLAAGATVIAAAGLAMLFNIQGDALHAAVGLALAAGAAGFLVHNFYPARIFMGDAGSLPLGFLLAALSLKLRFHDDINQGFILIPVALLLVVPLFDTALVTISRRNARRPIMSGGRDHTSHRLVQLGLSETRAVLILYGLGAVGFFAAKTVLHGSGSVLFLLSAGAAASCLLVGIFLLDISVYSGQSKGNVEKEPSSRFPLPVPALFVIEVSVDICVVSLAWVAAHYVRFQDHGLVDAYRVVSVIPILPYLIIAKLFAFYIFKLYRGMWRSIGVEDVSRIFKASALGSLLLLAGVALATRLQDLSRVVVILDWFFTLVGILMARAAFRAMSRWSRRMSVVPYKAVLLGSSALAPTLRRAISNDPSIDFAGVISAEGEPVMGDVLGDAANAEEIIREREIDILFIADEAWNERLSSLIASTGVFVRQVRLQID